MNVLGPVHLLKAYKWHPDVAQPQLNSVTFFRPCTKLIYCMKQSDTLSFETVKWQCSIGKATEVLWFHGLIK